MGFASTGKIRGSAGSGCLAWQSDSRIFPVHVTDKRRLVAGRRALTMASMNLHEQLAALGLSLPPAPKPVAAYVPAVRSGNLVFVSGQLPMKDGQLLATGPVPSKCSFDQAHAAARQCVLNALAVLGDQVGGDFSRVVRIVRLGVFVQSDDGWTEQPKVANGGSELLQQLFGEAGRHARAAVGTNALPLGASVEIEMLAEVR